MNRWTKKAWLGAALAACVAVGGGSAFAATTPSAPAPWGSGAGHMGKFHHPQNFDWTAPVASYLGMTTAQVNAALQQGTTLSQLAQSHGKSVSGLEAAMLSAAQTRLDQAVQKGRMTSAQAQQMLSRMKTQISNQVTHPFRPFHPQGPDLGWAAPAASYLGLTTAQVNTALQQGTTLSQLAQSHGKSVSGLEAAMLSAAQTRLDQAVQKGQMTSTQAQKMLSRMKTQISNQVTHPFRPFRHQGPDLGWAAPAASYLGLTTAQVNTALQQGTTLSQLAQSHGKSVSGLEAAMLSAAQTRLDQAVQKGQMTSTQAQKMLGQMKTRMTYLMDHALPNHHVG